MSEITIYDTIIIGSGPSGLTAATYSARASMKTLVIAGCTWGGQLMQTTDVENYPGFPEGIQGPELMMHMRAQAERFGVELIEKDATAIDISKRPFSVTTEEGEYQGKTVIIATGADAIWLGVPGEDKYKGKGVSSCAPCDAFFYKNKQVIVVGGGDSAMEEALVLTRFATRVTIIHRRSEFRASQIMQERVKNHEKIDIIWNSEIINISGDQTVNTVKIKTKPSDLSLLKKSTEELQHILPEQTKGTILEKVNDAIIWEMPIHGVFVAIGHHPNSELFKGIVDLDEKGYVKRIANTKSQNSNLYTSATSVEGVFVSGDIHDHTYRQAITAAGYGCQAALDAERWLDENE